MHVRPPGYEAPFLVFMSEVYHHHHHHHHHHLAITELGHSFVRSGLTHPEMSLQWSPMVPSAFWFVAKVLKDKTIQKYILFHNVTK